MENENIKNREYIDNIVREVEKYIGGDKIFSPLWMVLQLILSLILSAVAVLLDIGKIASLYYSKMYYAQSIRSIEYNFQYMKVITIILLIITDILVIYILIVLISRRNTHFERTKKLYKSISKLLENIGLKEEAWKIEEYVNRCEIETGKRNVAGWVILAVLPIVNSIAIPYIYHFLTRDYFKHERYESLIYNVISKSIKVDLEPNGFPDRDTVMYFLLSIVTFGIAGIYWYYTLFADPNKHFKEHSISEEKILKTLITQFQNP